MRPSMWLLYWTYSIYRSLYTLYKINKAYGFTLALYWTYRVNMEFLCLEVDLQSKKLLLCNILCRQTADSFHNIEEGGPPILCYRKFS